MATSMDDDCQQKTGLTAYEREILRRIVVSEENCTILGYYAANSGNSLPTFRYNWSVPSSRDPRGAERSSLKMGPMGCPERR